MSTPAYKNKPYYGIYPMLFAFFNQDNRLDHQAMAKQVEFCIESGVHGITVLGLVTEAHKMQVEERLELMQWVGECIGGRVKYAVTVVEPSLAAQQSFAQAAAKAGADWVILQPPLVQEGAVMTEAALFDFFGEVSSSLTIDVAIQNNPINLPVSLSTENLIRLNQQYPNISLLKAEGFSVEIAEVIRGSNQALSVFGGHGGIEFISLLRSGGVGLIPAPNYLKPQVRIFELWQESTPAAQARAEAIHRQLLPSIVFMSRSIEGMICYGKRLFCQQADIPLGFERAPVLSPTSFGLAEIAQQQGEIEASQ